MSTSTNLIESSGVHRASCGPTKVFKGRKGRVRCVVYFPDGRRIAGAFTNKTIIIWDVESGRQDGQPLQHDSIVHQIVISPNGERIASGTGSGLVVWDVLTRQVVHEIKGIEAWRLAYSPDGHWIVIVPSHNGGQIHLCYAATGRPGRQLLRCDGRISCVAWSPDGMQIAVGFAGGSFAVIDISTGESVVGLIKGHAEFVSSVVYSPDGSYLVTTSWDQNIRVWDSKTGVQVGQPMLGHKRGVYCTSITADGRRIASAGGDIRVWDLETRLQVGHSFNADGWAESVAFSPNGRYIISGEDHLSLWDTESFGIQGSSSPPTTTVRNEPKVGDHTHSVTSPTPVPSTVPQESHQTISRLCDALSKPRISVSLVSAPNDWLRANTSQILQVPSIHGNERVGVDLIYPRLFVYTLEYLECYAPSEAEALKAKYIKWTDNVDETTQLTNHESIMNTLDRYLAQHETKFQPNDPTMIDEISKLDALCIIARMLAMLEEPQRRMLLLGQTGPQAQSLLDLMQKLLDSFDLDNVRSFLVKILVELSKRSGLYPQRLVLPHIDIRDGQVAGGTFGDVWKGDLGGRAVAVKKMRVFDSRDVQALMNARPSGI